MTGGRVGVVAAAGVGLLGVALLVAGSVQVASANVVAGLPVATAGFVLAPHRAADPAAVVRAHAAPPAPQVPAGPAASAPKPTGNPPPAPPPPPVARPAQGAQLPNTIALPKGGTAYLVRGQVAADGSLPIPSGVDQATWWGTGLSAAAGATVFAGHVNWAGATGPFAELWRDVAGDVVSIRDTSGTAWRFRITEVLTLSKDQLPQQAPALFAPTGPRRIVLATCGGEWVGGAQGYADNRVLVALPIA